MTTAELCKLPVEKLAETDCALFLWTTGPMLPDALRVITEWGFAFKTIAFNWVKTTGGGIQNGLGHYTRSGSELCLIATKGKPKRQSKRVRQVLLSPLREHSRKPDEVRQRIEELYGDVPRIELFAREKVDGWDAWGNDVEPDVWLKESP